MRRVNSNIGALVALSLCATEFSTPQTAKKKGQFLDPKAGRDRIDALPRSRKQRNALKGKP